MNQSLFTFTLTRITRRLRGNFRSVYATTQPPRSSQSAVQALWTYGLYSIGICAMEEVILVEFGTSMLGYGRIQLFHALHGSFGTIQFVQWSKASFHAGFSTQPLAFHSIFLVKMNILDSLDADDLCSADCAFQGCLYGVVNSLIYLFQRVTGCSDVEVPVFERLPAGVFRPVTWGSRILTVFPSKPVRCSTRRFRFR